MKKPVLLFLLSIFFSSRGGDSCIELIDFSEYESPASLIVPTNALDTTPPCLIDPGYYENRMTALRKKELIARIVGLLTRHGQVCADAYALILVTGSEEFRSSLAQEIGAELMQKGILLKFFLMGVPSDYPVPFVLFLKEYNEECRQIGAGDMPSTVFLGYPPQVESQMYTEWLDWDGLHSYLTPGTAKKVVMITAAISDFYKTHFMEFIQKVGQCISEIVPLDEKIVSFIRFLTEGNRDRYSVEQEVVRQLG